MEEILALPYDDPDGPSLPGPETGELVRANFDNADDYHGLSEAPGSVVDLAGALYDASVQDFGRSVEAGYGSEDFVDLGTISGLTVTVTVQDAVGTQWQLTRFVPAP